MSVLIELDKYLKPELYKLRYKKSILGMRAKMYNFDKRAYEYFDFYTDKIESDSIKKYLKENESTFRVADLQQYGDLFLTEDEYKTKYVVTEIEDVKKVESLLKKYMYVQQVNESMTEVN